MESNGYTLIDVPVLERLWPDLDLIVAVMEHVRLNLRAIDPRIPRGAELVLLAGCTSHGGGPVPLLAMSLPAQLPQGPEVFDLEGIVNVWCQEKSDNELKSIGRATVAPTWSELLTSGVHPAGQGAS